MRKLFLGLISIGCLSAFAKGPMDSIKLMGKYKLVKVSSRYAKKYYCSEEVEIKVTEHSVVIENVEGIYSYDSFRKADAGCESRAGEFGPLRIT